ncbi:hypothetical protein [Crocosphaera chwakensis]|uniref:50S ribosomal protein L3 n=1 Tax=Crocosphaera chwakensis CCY0110 TaxID=391612 RepID=A3IQ01_9CHRO|nr:hypothetical protein [Crocosphaera chwakensis]EAZ91341.1 50S ribosomal protein L3 [Crocosphaera chwakensis CCY0110]
MNNKPIIYGVTGFISGAVVVILIGILGMSGMMWGMGGMMNGMFRGRCDNYSTPTVPNN